jgi:hypothetical protein
MLYTLTQEILVYQVTKNVAHVKIKTNLHASSVEAVIIVIVQNNSHNHPNKSNNQRLSMCMVK